jgi:hypothetical protein
MKGLPMVVSSIGVLSAFSLHETPNAVQQKTVKIRFRVLAFIFV